MVRTPLSQQQQQKFVTPPQQYRTEFRCSPTTGRQWSVQVPVDAPVVNPSAATAAQPVYEWKRDPKTGERWQVILATKSQPQYQNPPTSSGQAGSVHNHGQGQPQPSSFTNHNPGYSPNLSNLDLSQQSQSNISNLSRTERVAGIVSLLEGGGGTKKH